jgi:hypothetical protein
MDPRQGTKPKHKQLIFKVSAETAAVVKVSTVRDYGTREVCERDMEWKLQIP